MKTMFKVGLAALSLAASAALAQGFGYGPGMMGGGMMGGRGLGSLNLTPEQEEKIFAIQEQHRAGTFPTMSKMRGEMFRLRKLMRADNPDAGAVVEQQKKVDDLRRQMLASHLETRKEVEKVLTPEQRKQLRQLGPWWMDADDD